ncbi:MULTISPECIES: hypothetical protein [Streptomyces]
MAENKPAAKGRPMSDRFTPTPEHTFTRGPRTAGWRGDHPAGDATRPAPDPVDSAHRRAGPGGYGMAFHDDGLAPSGSCDAEREATAKRLRTEHLLGAR